MSRKANKTAIGIFVTGALALLVIGISVFGSGMLFEKADKYVLFFDGSVKGLTTGAPVVFRGVKIGNVDQINLLYDRKTERTCILVIIKVELSRVKGVPDRIGYPDYGELIKKGLRARLDVQSFVTGQLIVSFDFYQDKPARLLGIMEQYPELPTLPMSPSVLGIVQDLPLKEIANNLKETTAGINKLVNSEGFRGIDDAIMEITQTVRSMRL
ncbi:MAG: MlaD family protein, partial [bacterium]|nr:MlaD family protein [bacterium]